MTVVDLRSDTVTRPSEPMLRAMAAAEVGDDVYGEDPTTNALESELADRFGHAAAVFVPTGTMGNQIALRLLCPPGAELICDADSHVVSYEAGALAQHGGVQSRTVVASRGLLSSDLLAAQIREPGFHTVPTRAVSVEQTHNRGGGSVYPLPLLDDITELAARYALTVHCDGARIWNAHIASGVPLTEYGARFDTLMVSFSKGLGAPVGSAVLLRDPSLEAPARELRHALGGAMRQVGVLAAAAQFALQHNLSRLAEDHERAQRLADGLAQAVPGLIEPTLVETNIVPLDLTVTELTASELADKCRAEGVLVSTVAAQRVRLVTHLDIDDGAVDRALDVVRQALTGS